MSERYDAALAKWQKEGGARPARRPDNIPTRIDLNWMTPAELAIRKAMEVVESAGGSPALTDAITLLAKARDRVADHVETVAEAVSQTPKLIDLTIQPSIEEQFRTMVAEESVRRGWSMAEAMRVMQGGSWGEATDELGRRYTNAR